MGSKAIAVVIIGMGIMVLIVSACIGAPAGGRMHTFSGWPAQAHILTIPAMWKQTGHRGNFPPGGAAAGRQS